MTGDHLSLIVTSDGSHSLLNTQIDETYHSQYGAVQESTHVFIKMGLEHFIAKSGTDEVRIFEVGFGTGLNALLASRYADSHHVSVHYTSVEAFPLPPELTVQLNYATILDDMGLFQEIHSAGWGGDVPVTPRFTLKKVHTRLQDHVPAPMDVIFFDAFAPAKQPEMWDLPLLGKTCKPLTAGGILVTYSAKGQLKRDLKAIGLTVETLPGPPGKKEMVRAIKGETSNFAK